jgi:hypothetical protein
MLQLVQVHTSNLQQHYCFQLQHSYTQPLMQQRQAVGTRDVISVSSNNYHYNCLLPRMPAARREIAVVDALYNRYAHTVWPEASSSLNEGDMSVLLALLFPAAAVGKHHELDRAGLNKADWCLIFPAMMATWQMWHVKVDNDGVGWCLIASCSMGTSSAGDGRRVHQGWLQQG